MTKMKKIGMAAAFLAVCGMCCSPQIKTISAAEAQTEAAPEELSDEWSVQANDLSEDEENYTESEVMGEYTEIPADSSDVFDNSDVAEVAPDSDTVYEEEDLTTSLDARVDDDFMSDDENFETEIPDTDQVRNGSCGADEEMVFWSLDEAGVLSIIGEGRMAEWAKDTDVPWSEFRSEIKAIEIEEGISSIGAYAFFNCENAGDIDIPESVQEIGAFAFFNCNGLSTISIG
jgi:hypothetical protein